MQLGGPARGTCCKGSTGVLHKSAELMVVRPHRIDWPLEKLNLRRGCFIALDLLDGLERARHMERVSRKVAIVSSGSKGIRGETRCGWGTGAPRVTYGAALEAL
jgi:hypothetical protein